MQTMLLKVIRLVVTGVGVWLLSPIWLPIAAKVKIVSLWQKLLPFYSGISVHQSTCLDS